MNFHFSKTNLILIVLLCISVSQFSKAQGIAVNSNGASADSSAMLDVTSTSKGLLIPRMTTVQRDAIANPATSLLVFNSTVNNYQFFDGGVWQNLLISNQWKTAGNSGVNPSANFIGTTDLTAIPFRTNNTERMRLDSAGNLGIGVSFPNSKLQVKGTFDAGDSNYRLIYNNDVIPGGQPGIHYVGALYGDPASGNPFYLNGLLNLPGEGPQSMTGYLNFSSNSNSTLTCKPGEFKAEVDTASVSSKLELIPFGVNNCGFDLEDNSSTQSTRLKLGLNGIDFRINNPASGEMQEEQWNHLDWNHRIYDPTLHINAFTSFFATHYNTYFHDSVSHIQFNTLTNSESFGGSRNNLTNANNSQFLFDTSFSFVSYTTNTNGSIKVGAHNNLWALNQVASGDYTSIGLENDYVEFLATDFNGGTQSKLRLIKDGTVIFGSGVNTIKVGINSNNPTEALEVNGNSLITGNGLFQTGLSVGTTATPVSTLMVNGSVSGSLLSDFNQNYTLTSSDFCVTVNTTNTVLYLPAAAGCTGRIYIMKDMTGSGFYISPNSSESIDGITGTYSATGAVQLMSDGANWVKIN